MVVVIPRMALNGERWSSYHKMLSGTRGEGDNVGPAARRRSASPKGETFSRSLSLGGEFNLVNLLSISQRSRKNISPTPGKALWSIFNFILIRRSAGRSQQTAAPCNYSNLRRATAVSAAFVVLSSSVCWPSRRWQGEVSLRELRSSRSQEIEY